MKRTMRFKIPELGISVREGFLKDGRKGYWNPDTREIVIHSRLGWTSKNTILVHELLHALDDQLIASQITKRRLPHDWIESAALNLLLLLVLAGRWKGITKTEMLKFYSGRPLK